MNMNMNITKLKAIREQRWHDLKQAELRAVKLEHNLYRSKGWSKEDVDRHFNEGWADMQTADERMMTAAWSAVRRAKQHLKVVEIVIDVLGDN